MPGNWPGCKQAISNITVRAGTWSGVLVHAAVLFVPHRVLAVLSRAVVLLVVLLVVLVVLLVVLLVALVVLLFLALVVLLCLPPTAWRDNSNFAVRGQC